MKTWQILFKQAPKNDDGAQGGSTGDEDFDDAADDALVAEGEAELEEGEADEEEEELDDDSEEEEQSDEDQDDTEEEEEGEEEDVDEEEEEAPATSGFKFKNPKTGDFDFAKINKALGGNELEKLFKEQSATITRTSQENAQYKRELGSPKLKERTQKGDFLDRMMAQDPGVKKEVLRFLHGGNPGQGQGTSDGKLQFEGVDPDDPLLPVLQELVTTVHGFQNQQREQSRQAEDQEYNRNLETGLRSAYTRFKELVGRDATEDEMNLVADEMERTGDLKGERFIAHLFLEDIRKAERQRVIRDRKVKRKLPKAPSGRRLAPTKKRKSKEEWQDDLWNEHKGGDE